MSDTEVTMNPLSKDFKLRGGCARAVRYGFAPLSALQKSPGAENVSVAGLKNNDARRKLLAHILGAPVLATAAGIEGLTDEKVLRTVYENTKIAVLGKHKTKKLLESIMTLPSLLPDVVVLSDDINDLKEHLPEGVRAALVTLARGAIIRAKCFNYINEHSDMFPLGMMKGPKKAVKIDRSKPLSKLPAVVLKAVCRERGCRPSGKKGEILARLAIFGGEFKREEMTDSLSDVLPENPEDIIEMKNKELRTISSAIGVMCNRPFTKSFKSGLVALYEHPLWPEIPSPPSQDILDEMHDQDVTDLAKLLLFPKAWNAEEYRIGLQELRDGVEVVGGGAKERLKAARAAKKTDDDEN